MFLQCFRVLDTGGRAEELIVLLIYLVKRLVKGWMLVSGARVVGHSNGLELGYVASVGPRLTTSRIMPLYLYILCEPIFPSLILIVRRGRNQHGARDDVNRTVPAMGRPRLESVGRASNFLAVNATGDIRSCVMTDDAGTALRSRQGA